MEPVYTYIANFVSDHDTWFKRLKSELAWEQREGTPRQEYWANHDGRDYTYGRGRGIRTYEAQPTHELIDLGRQALVEKHGVLLEGCFLNRYDTSSNWLGFHSDDDAGIDHTKPIAVITLGQGRPIVFRKIVSMNEGEKPVFGDKEEVMLEAGSLCLMHAGSQFTHQHAIPKLGYEAGGRISMTYRGLIALPKAGATENEPVEA